MFEVEIRHDGLHKYRVIRGRELYEVQEKAEVQRRAWDEMWEKHLERERIAQQRAQKAKNHEDNKELALELTEEASSKITAIQNTLSDYLKSPATINWESLKDKTTFSKPVPRKKTVSRKPEETIPPKPLETAVQYIPQFSFIDYFFPSRKQKKIVAAKEAFQKDCESWESKKEEIITLNQKNGADLQEALKKAEELFAKQQSEWEKEKAAFDEQQQRQHDQIELMKKEYLGGTKQGLEDSIELILYKSDYPESFPEEYTTEYNPENKLIIIDYILPNPEHLPTLKEVRYIQSRSEFKEAHLNENAIQKMYDDLLYKISLRTLHEVFSADGSNHVQSIVSNGWVDFIDKSTGLNSKACIMSIHVTREEFMSINLEMVDSKACFKKLKGVGSSKLHSLTPIAPLMRLNREDTRFVSSYDVTDSLDDSVNLAAMDWQDFEHLIREIFEKEFSQGGGEVKITRASRDGGVDAVVFDPDPIRGGKIVIQAKRYTNTVGVSAVRDLYGTVMNEGAIKGILVSTADYGPDAYGFAKDKPLTLLDGANLLYLLQKHGHKAKIDLKEAKKILP